MRLSDFDYYLPKELIAQYPLKKRDASRLLVLDRNKRRILDHKFCDLIDYLQCGDTLVLNDTKVIPARLIGHREGTGGKVDFLLLERVGKDTFSCLVKPNRRLKKGNRICFDSGKLIGEVMDDLGCEGRSSRRIRFNHAARPLSRLKEIGKVPLPPYIKREPGSADRLRYQTVYARKEGAVAAPTAGLHFTRQFLKLISAKGVNIAFLTLHVGYGTFRPVTTENIADHQMHREYFTLPKETAEILNETKKRGNRVFAVGTTTLRVLEAAASPKGKLLVPASARKGACARKGARVKAKKGWTDLFIYPPYKFRFVDCLLTNFHLPRTTLVMLVSALSGRKFLLRAYREAMDKGYRFYSYGDAMLII